MEPIVLTSANFEEEALHASVPVLIDFWAVWCGPCKMISPVVDEIAAESDGSYKVCKVNVDDESELASRFGIMSIPTLVVLKNGEIAASSVGVKSKQAILDMLA